MTVNRKWKVRFGREAFKQFILSLLASQAYNTGLAAQDRPIPPQRTVTREELLNRFLAVRPEFQPFRAELADVYAILPELSVNSVLWQKLPAG